MECAYGDKVFALERRRVDNNNNRSSPTAQGVRTKDPAWFARSVWCSRASTADKAINVHASQCIDQVQSSNALAPSSTRFLARSKVANRSEGEREGESEGAPRQPFTLHHGD